MAELQLRLQQLNWSEEQYVKSPLKGKKGQQQLSTQALKAISPSIIIYTGIGH